MVEIPTILLALALVFGVWLPVGLLVRDLFVETVTKYAVARYDVTCLQARAAGLLEDDTAGLREQLTAAGVEAHALDGAVEVAQQWATGHLQAAALREATRRGRRDPQDVFAHDQFDDEG